MLRALAAGLAGAAALNALHESARHLLPDAPRVDLLGRRAVLRAFGAAGEPPPSPAATYGLALTGDLVSNGAYFAGVGVGDAEGAPLRGLLLGAAGGALTVLLPPALGFSSAPVRRTAQTAAMTVAWYAAGGLVAGLLYRALAA